MKHRSDYASDPGFPGCCDSCHEDDDAGTAPLAEDDERRMCCKVLRWVEPDAKPRSQDE